MDLFERMYREYEEFWTAERKEKPKSLQMSPMEVGHSGLHCSSRNKTRSDEKGPGSRRNNINRLERNIPLTGRSHPAFYALGDFSIRRVLNDAQKR